MATLGKLPVGSRYQTEGSELSEEVDMLNRSKKTNPIRMSQTFVIIGLDRVIQLGLSSLSPGHIELSSLATSILRSRDQSNSELFTNLATITVRGVPGPRLDHQGAG